MKSTNPMAALFGKSPFKPIQEHMRIVTDCVGEVPALFEGVHDCVTDLFLRQRERKGFVFAQIDRKFHLCLSFDGVRRSGGF